MKALAYLLAATAAIHLAACKPAADTGGANNMASAQGAAMLCAFQPADQRGWSGNANADQSVTVAGQAHVANPKYRAQLFHLEVQGSVARLYLTQAENHAGQAPADGWWSVEQTIPDNGSIQTVEIWCDMDTMFNKIPVRRGSEPAAPGGQAGTGATGVKVAFRGCPRIVKVSKPEGCLVVRSGTETYDIDSAQPRPDPGRLIIDGTGIYDQGKVGLCPGKHLDSVQWSYTRTKCPLGGKE